MTPGKPTPSISSMTGHGEYREHWRTQSKCAGLTPQETDRLFFPGNGGKPKKADAYCSTCPVLSQCLTEAIENRLEGFWAGTTDDQRKSMAAIHGIRTRALELPPEPDRTKRRIYRKLVVAEDPHKYLDEIEPDEVELVALEVTIVSIVA